MMRKKKGMNVEDQEIMPKENSFVGHPFLSELVLMMLNHVLHLRLTLFQLGKLRVGGGLQRRTGVSFFVYVFMDPISSPISISISESIP